MTRSIQLSYLPCIKYFGPPVSVSCPVYRNINDEECLPLVSVSKGMCILSLELRSHEPERYRRVSFMTEIFPLSSAMSYVLGNEKARPKECSVF